MRSPPRPTRVSSGPNTRNRVDLGYERWVLETQHHTGTLPDPNNGNVQVYWPSSGIGHAIAGAFKRRIHHYIIKNPHRQAHHCREV